jgi:HSP20 family protein
MSLVKWTPMRGLRVFDDEVGRWFDDFFPPMVKGFANKEGYWSPAVDVTESPTEFSVKAELPGMKQEEIKVTLLDQNLTISGERKIEKEEKDKNYHRIERSYGSFQRSFHLPSRIDAAKIKAAYKDGVLEVTLPKAAEAREKEINVEVK